MHEDEPLPSYPGNASTTKVNEANRSIPHNKTSKEETKEPPSYYYPPIGEIPYYFQEINLKHWNVVINTRYFSNGTIFVGNKSINKYELFKTKPNDLKVMKLQNKGIGVPLFQIKPSSNLMSSKYLTFYKHLSYPLSTNFKFDVKNKYFNYCTVEKSDHLGYTSYVFNFTPDSSSSSSSSTTNSNFQVILFSHSILPINDFIYKGKRLRWIDESNKPFFKRLNQVNWGYKLTTLNSNQPSLCDNWDDVVQSEYYGDSTIAILGEAQSEFELGKLRLAELKFNDIYNNDKNDNSIDYNSLYSLNEETLVFICIATVLKNEKDKFEERRKVARSNNKFASSLGLTLMPGIPQ
ncbi:uncharacterized protein KGF55_000980 [Candida pseudojiufengensis]|uniref:uncharacterized protein n=1 Tax=Candida pseudojiufengensis TaxID=497109 RepID=UPI00222536FE|nr:uncharacterized protein KGF55_000980 [Candida pseudojiufengensis]KAI5965618.1 hypothetical protein KGF55_000980 [Candida pseudojiufengensis]